jgi:hypothetical protein
MTPVRACSGHLDNLIKSNSSSGCRGTWRFIDPDNDRLPPAANRSRPSPGMALAALPMEQRAPLTDDNGLAAVPLVGGQHARRTASTGSVPASCWPPALPAASAPAPRVLLRCRHHLSRQPPALGPSIENADVKARLLGDSRHPLPSRRRHPRPDVSFECLAGTTHWSSP